MQRSRWLNLRSSGPCQSVMALYGWADPATSGVTVRGAAVPGRSSTGSRWDQIG